VFPNLIANWQHQGVTGALFSIIIVIDVIFSSFTYQWNFKTICVFFGKQSFYSDKSKQIKTESTLYFLQIGSFPLRQSAFNSYLGYRMPMMSTLYLAF
jgi:hypothetical protein